MKAWVERREALSMHDDGQCKVQRIWCVTVHFPSKHAAEIFARDMEAIDHGDRIQAADQQVSE